MESSSLLGLEWQTLQENHERHEQNALLIKVSCLALSIAGLAGGLALSWIAFTILLCWIQEGIFKTYQARLSDRLLKIESLLGQTEPTEPPMQLHAEWASSRPGGGALITGYITSALRPTVAFPYLPMLLMLPLGRWLAWL
ncbi:MAG: hypothetical protein JNJ95_01215 [Dechloromonas sp.]|nr:hypothetical protein [Dechloromonas sp.]